jgi:nucleoid DNA-binding protein
VKHPNNYPGKHQASQPRTYEAAKPLDPKAQFHLVIKSMGEYIRENMQAGKGVNYKTFGAFAFEVNTDLVKPAQLSNFDITKDLDNQREERKHNHKNRPCFVPDQKFQNVLLRFPGKEEM